MPLKTKACKINPDRDMITLLRACAQANKSKAMEAQHFLAKALELPLRDGVLLGDILFDIFEVIPFAPGVSVEFPLDLLAPGTEKDFVAYTVPNFGSVPSRNTEGDYVMVPTFDIGNSIGTKLKYIRDARWDVVSRLFEILEAGFVKKMNDDGWHVILASGVDRNILVYDADAAQGTMSKRVVTLLRDVMRRNGGGNSTSMNRRKLTDLYMSPEAMSDMTNWTIDQLDDVTRRSIITSADGRINGLWGVEFHDLDELGQGQEYQLYYEQVLGASVASGDVEILVGLDQSVSKSFVMPQRQAIEIHEDETVFRSNRFEVYGRGEYGYAALDGRLICLASI